MDLARQCGLAVEDQDGELRPDVLDAISRTVSATTWFGLTTGYLGLTGKVQHSPQGPAPLTAGSGRAAIRARGREGKPPRGWRVLVSEFIFEWYGR
jgi:hypothetical protein